MAATADFVEPESFPVERLTFGKLVCDRDGPIARGAVSEVTSASAGLDRFIRPALSPQFLTGNGPWNPTDLCDDERGALLVCPVALRADAAPHMVAARVRFRSEAGEKQAGRVTPQSSMRFFRALDWTRHAPFVVDQILPGLVAIPDLAQAAACERLMQDPLAVRGRPLPDIAVGRVPKGVWLIIDCLAEGRHCRLGRETFISENAFLRGLAFVFDLFAGRPDSALGVSWVSGYKGADASHVLQYFPDRGIAGTRFPSAFAGCHGWRDQSWRHFAAEVRRVYRSGEPPTTATESFQRLHRAVRLVAAAMNPPRPAGQARADIDQAAIARPFLDTTRMLETRA